MQEGKSNNTLVLVLLGIVAVVLVVIVVLLVLLVTRDEGATTPPPTDTPAGIVEPTAVDPPVVQPPTLEPAPTLEIPTPEPQDPSGTVIAPDGVNLRSGPGTNYPVVGTAPFGEQGELAGISQDGQWYAAILQEIPLTLGWVAAPFIEVTNGDALPVLQTPPTPTPTATPTPAATPTPTIAFSADSLTLNSGECTTLRWNSDNVQAVYVYELGQPYQNYPAAGNGSQEVCPTTTTTYEMRVEQRDATVQLRQVTITVNQSNPLAGTNWTLSTLIGNPLVAGTSITTSFASDGSLSANGGCNTFGASYSVSGNVLSVTPLQGTNIACEDAILTQEAAFTSALQSANTFEIVNNQLIIQDPAGREVLRYNR